MMNRALTPVILLWLAAAVTIAGCDTSFEVFGESDVYFSLFGYLDASADTQWVRVEALQDSLLYDTKPLNAVFTMTHPATSRRVVWHDSLFEYPGGARAYNFWTDEPILPLETYQLDITRSDGAFSAASVTLPDSFPEPELDTFPFSIISRPTSGDVCARRLELVIDNIDQFAALQVTYVVPTRRGFDRTFRVSYIPYVVFTRQGNVEVTIEWASDLADIAAINGDIGISELLGLKAVELLVAAAGPGWPDNALDDETVALPGAVTHVENGFGFVGGVVSWRMDVPIGNFRDVSCFQ